MSKTYTSITSIFLATILAISTSDVSAQTIRDSKSGAVTGIKIDRPHPAHMTVNPSQIKFSRSAKWGSCSVRFPTTLYISDEAGRIVYQTTSLPYLPSSQYTLGEADDATIAKLNARLSIIESQGKKVTLNFDYLDALTNEAAVKAKSERDRLKGQKVAVNVYDSSIDTDAADLVELRINPLEPEKFFDASNDLLDRQSLAHQQTIQQLTDRLEALEKRVEKLEHRR